MEEINNLPLTETIETVVESCIIKPILVNCEHSGVLLDHNSIEKCEILWNKNNSMIPTVTTKKFGKIYTGEEQSNPDLCNNFLILRNKKSHKLKLYATDSYFLKRYQRNKETVAKEEEILEDKKPAIETTIKDLNKAFASKKAKKFASDSEKMAANSENILDKIKSVSESTVNTDSDDNNFTPITNSELYLPPCDRSALSIQQAYKLHNIVTLDELNSIHSSAEKILNEGTVNLNPKKYSKFLVALVSQIKDLDIKKLKILIVADSLVSFLSVPNWKLQSKHPEVCHYSSLINKKLIDEFTAASSNGRCRPTYMRDKTLSYLLVLLFIVNNYTIDIKWLSNVISIIDYKRLPLLVRAIGAKQSTASLTTYVLKLPLNQLLLPNVKSLKRKRM